MASKNESSGETSNPDIDIKGFRQMADWLRNAQGRIEEETSRYKERLFWALAIPTIAVVAICVTAVVFFLGRAGDLHDEITRVATQNKDLADRIAVLLPQVSAGSQELSGNHEQIHLLTS